MFDQQIRKSFVGEFLQAHHAITRKLLKRHQVSASKPINFRRSEASRISGARPVEGREGWDRRRLAMTCSLLPARSNARG